MHSCRIGQFLSVMLVVLGFSIPAFGQWVAFTNETASRISATSSLVQTDSEEKDYGVGDFDNDGDDDLAIARKQPFTSTGRRVNVLLMNQDGVLTERTADFAVASDVAGDLGFNTPTNDRDLGVVDVNGDGWLDLVTVTTLSDGQPKHISHPRIYINLGNSAGDDPLTSPGTSDPATWLGFEYQDARIPMLGGINPGTGQPHAPRFCSVDAADFDQDGDMDLYFGDYDSGGAQTLDFNDRLLVNDGNGFFTDETTSRFVGNIVVSGTPFQFYQSAFGTSVEFADFNGDGTIDLMKDTALNPPQYVGVSLNNGSGTPGNVQFSNHTVVNQAAPYFVETGDLNGDGMVDFIVSDDGDDHYHLNTTTPGSTNVSFTSTNFVGPDPGFGGNNMLEDLNNDGWLDVIITGIDIDITGGLRRTQIFRNNGASGTIGGVPNVTFTEIQGDTGVYGAAADHDIAFIDLNNDGWLDMISGKHNGTVVWVNDPPGGLIFTYPLGLPGTIGCDEASTFQIQLDSFGGATAVAGSLEFFVSTNNGPFVSQPVTDLGGDLYEMTIPANSLATRVEWYATAEETGGTTATEPSGGASAPYSLFAADQPIEILDDDIEGSTAGWVVQTGPGLTSGAWEVATPNGTTQGATQVAPGEDATAGSQNTQCWVTENGAPGGTAGSADVDGGFNRLLTPKFDLAGTDGTIEFSVWHVSSDNVTAEQDDLIIQISNNDGATWTPLDVISTTNSNWENRSYLASDFTIPTANMIVRFTSDDNPNNSITESAIDNFVVTRLECDAVTVEFSRGDINQDGGFDVSDPVALLDYTFAGGALPGCLDAADGNDDGSVNIADAVLFLEALFGGSGVTPSAPFPGCGVDPTDDGIDCVSFSQCP